MYYIVVGQIWQLLQHGMGSYIGKPNQALANAFRLLPKGMGLRGGAVGMGLKLPAFLCIIGHDFLSSRTTIVSGI